MLLLRGCSPTTLALAVCSPVTTKDARPLACSAAPGVLLWFSLVCVESIFIFFCVCVCIVCARHTLQFLSYAWSEGFVVGVTQ